MVALRLDHLSAEFAHAERATVAAVRDVTLDVPSGELLTLLGPSGCGKTTTLRIIAGFQAPSSGRLLIDGEDMTQVPANRRDIGFVFQNYALFPHLTVAENVAYGLRVRRRPAASVTQEVGRVLELVGLAGYGPRSPHELSGGQQQRVALARAIVIRTRLLLFDEPLSNLDARLRVQMRDEIRSVQKLLGITTVYVTHDQEEAMAISDRIAVMEAGQVAQYGAAEELYRRPASRFVAGFLGRTNLIEGVVASCDRGSVVVDVAGTPLVVRTLEGAAPGTAVAIAMRPEAIGIGPAGSGLAATVRSSTYLGDKVEYVVQWCGTPIHVVRSNPPAAERFRSGAAVSLTLPDEGIVLLQR
jgi:iron(III) transport system ATP-binding protein